MTEGSLLFQQSEEGSTWHFISHFEINVSINLIFNNGSGSTRTIKYLKKKRRLKLVRLENQEGVDDSKT